MKNTKKKKKEVNNMRADTLMRKYRKLSFQMFIENGKKANRDYELIDKCNSQMLEIEEQLKGHRIYLH